MYLYNSLTRTKEKFNPIDNTNIRMYVCGPTLYDDIHIGNARPLIIFDVLYKILQIKYGKNSVTYIRNITDIDDKIITRANNEYPNLPIENATKELLNINKINFKNVCELLNCNNLSNEPMVSENLAAIYEIITKLVKNNYAYIAEDHILFDISKYVDYGKLSKRNPEELLAGARIEVAKYKKNPGDFVLWKPAKANEPSWESPCGIAKKGRPGWHIECSAMANRYLGNNFDIHGGGIDLMFPHHENEIAQSCCAFEVANMANYWLHNGYVEVEGKKMSKSEGNFIKVKDIVTNHFGGNSLRLAMLQTHYRKNFNWTKDLYENAKIEYKNWRVMTDNIKALEDIPEIFEALTDDLNTPQAITIMREYYKDKKYAKLAQAMKWLLGNLEVKVTFNIEKLLEIRQKFIVEKNWRAADKIRDELAQKGYSIQDIIENGERTTKITQLF